MPPKHSAKKRKAPETSQLTMDAFTSVQPSRSKPVAENTQPTASQSEQGLLHSNDIINGKDTSTVNITALLGTFRQKTMVDRIEVRHFKDTRATSISNSQLQETWQKLGNLVEAVLNGKPVEISLQVAYELCQSLCLYGKANELFDHLVSALSNYVQEQRAVLLEAAKDDSFLGQLDMHWNDFCKRLVIIRNVFMELDRRYVMIATNFASIIHLGKQMFRKFIMEVPRIQSVTINNLLQLIKRDRDGIQVDLNLIHSITHMMLDLTLYADFFEPSFMSATMEYYAFEANMKLNELSMPDYLQHVDQRIKQESEHRVDTYLDETTKAILAETVTEQLLYSKANRIIEQGFKDMMDKAERKPLHILYHYLSRHQRVGDLRNAFANYIKGVGTELIKDPSKDQHMVPSLLQYKEQMDKLLKHSFDDNPSFANAMKESFENFINSRKNKPAEMLAKFFDSKLRSHTKKQMEEDIELLLDKVLVIFRYLQGKDVFEAFYKRFLSKRLLLNRTVSNDTEKNVLSKIKSECGPDFTKNLEGMFKDMEVSADLNTAFKESKEYADVGNTPIYVNVLAQGIWPSYPTFDIILPHNMLSVLQAYETFYTNKIKGRKLSWRNALGTCALKANFPSGSKELSVSLFQAVVLLLFNDESGSDLTYKDIALATNLDEKELKRILQSLACGRHKILLKQSQVDDIDESDIFKYNDQFSSTNFRLKINTLQQEQSSEERKETQSKVLVNRQHQLEAAIVRIMKAKKQMTHTALVNELFSQLKFPIDASDIKKRIETLIDRDYLSRDDADNSLYLYQS